MSDLVRLDHYDDIGIIVINNPPVNALGIGVRQGIAAALREAWEDETIASIVLVAEGRTFPAGADISEFDAPAQSPGLPELCDLVEASPKPVLAALHGTTLGGGLELAMAAHYRVAAEGSRLGLPEISLGLLPGAGGTQRAPRLMGADAALDLMLSGRMIRAETAYKFGLIDGVAPADQLQKVVVALAAETTQPRPTREMRQHLKDGAQFMARLAARRPQVSGSRAELAILDCVEAALLLPFDVGQERERAAFAECLASPASAALRHVFFAERHAVKFAELGAAKPAPVARVGLVGGGAMACEIASACLLAALPVTQVVEGEGGIDLAFDRIAAQFERAVKARRVSEEEGLRRLKQLRLRADLSSLADADLIIEAQGEDAALKASTIAALNPIAKAEAVIASHTEYCDLAPLQAAFDRPEAMLGLRLATPMAQFDLAEVSVAPDSRAEAVATLHDVLRGMGKLPVRVKAGSGLITMRLVAALTRVADRILLDGASPADVDQAMLGFGFPHGLYQFHDEIGLDIARSKRARQSFAHDPRTLYLADRLCEAGFLGRKVRRGYYLYADDALHSPTGHMNPDMLSRLEDERRAKSIEPRSFTAAEVMDQLRLCLINEGAHLLEEQSVSQPSDIDVALIHGFGYPRARGGPMHEADQMTLFEVARALEALAKADPPAWSVSRLLTRLASERATFAGL